MKVSSGPLLIIGYSLLQAESGTGPEAGFVSAAPLDLRLRLSRLSLWFVNKGMGRARSVSARDSPLLLEAPADCSCHDRGPGRLSKRKDVEEHS